MDRALHPIYSSFSASEYIQMSVSSMFAGAARTIAFTLLIVMAALTDGKKIEVTGRLLCCDKIVCSFLHTQDDK